MAISGGKANDLALHLVRSNGGEFHAGHNGVDLLVQEVEGGDGRFRHANLGSVTPKPLAFLQFFHDHVRLVHLATAPNALHGPLFGHERGGRKSIKAAALVGIDGSEFSIGTAFLGRANATQAGAIELGFILSENERYPSAKEGFATAGHIVCLGLKAGYVWFVFSSHVVRFLSWLS